MAAVARERIAAEGWRNVTVVQAPAEDAEIAVTADAALFCAVHDILQSPDALRNVLSRLRPGARVAAGGGKWAAPWMVGVNLLVRMLHAPYVRSFGGVRPAVELSGAADRGRPRPRGSVRHRLHRDRPGAPAAPVLAGTRRVLGGAQHGPRQAGVRSTLPRPGSTERHASNSAGANNCGALTQAP